MWDFIRLTAGGWAIGGVIITIAFAIIMSNKSAIYENFYLPSVMIGAVGGLFTGLALSRIQASIRRKQIIMITAGWAIALLIGFAVANVVRYSMRGYGDFFVLNYVIGGISGGILTGLILKMNKLLVQWKQVIIIALGWGIGLAISAIITYHSSLAVLSFFYSFEYAPGGDYGYSSVLFAFIALVMGQALGGAIGGGFMFWRLDKIRREVNG
jgi:hypothetical protein